MPGGGSRPVVCRAEVSGRWFAGRRLPDGGLLGRAVDELRVYHRGVWGDVGGCKGMGGREGVLRGSCGEARGFKGKLWGSDQRRFDRMRHGPKTYEPLT